MYVCMYMFQCHPVMPICCVNFGNKQNELCVRVHSLRKKV
jgi:hypothetical protein